MSEINEWQPLTARRGLRNKVTVDPLLPPALHAQLRYWMERRLIITDRNGPRVYPPLVLGAAAAAGLQLEEETPSAQMSELIGLCESNPLWYLDVIDEILSMPTPKPDREADAYLRDVLLKGGSSWTIRSDGKGLVQRVDATTQAAFDEAATPEDEASQHLALAWDAAYGLQRDPSDVWDHAIKAVESVLCPLILPNVPDPTLGKVLGQLRNQGHLYELGIEEKPSIDSAVAMLELIWVNPDRHGGGPTVREPTEPEAQAVLHLAATVVQWVRLGMMRRK